MASKTYLHDYVLTRINATTFRVNSARDYGGGGVTVSDDGSDPGDNPNILGDVSPDNFTPSNATGTEGTDYSAIYYQRVTSPGGGFVSKYTDASGGSNYLLYTNATYTGTTQQIQTAPGTTAICYAAGTLIRTARGDVPVEALEVGDLAVTASGAHRPIKWLGHRTIDCRAHANPDIALPIEIAAHAFGSNRPERDLRVSPGHAVCVDIVGEVLIPASSLCNGSTIRQIEVDTVEYWHVELETHDVLVANGLPAESYLDMGNRDFFVENDVIAFDASRDPDRVDPAARTHADFCRPFHDRGALVDVVRTQLAVRSRELGWTLADEPFADLHLVVDGKRIDPATRGLVARFALPADAGDVWLVSHAVRPCELGGSSDTRTLGVCLASLAFDDGFDRATVSVSDPALCTGFHEVEDGVGRWTQGRARLPASLWESLSGELTLRVELASAALPTWTAPAKAEQPAWIRAA